MEKYKEELDVLRMLRRLKQIAEDTSHEDDKVFVSTVRKHGFKITSVEDLLRCYRKDESISRQAKTK